ncbi:hypothetical protein BFC17_04360 [Alteromonas lipolytica]|uniref:2-hydroxyglutaryl-CoA dehydratase n=1 Tax=Alteromonas lipolytica TaxID=1856405 RepID=A0A1E8FDF4_9ALTE|nr:hypothetical protein BFC17_04360 [Alteromonas lipolytica]
MPTKKPAYSQNFARENAAYNREWFKDLQQRVKGGEPFAYVHINVPLEIFRAMGINVVVNQWWSSVVGAKRKTLRYKNMLKERGYRDNMCDYCSSGLASLMETDPEEAPWGGLPKPTVIVSGKGCSAVEKIFDLFSEEYGIPHISVDVAASPISISDVVSDLSENWDKYYDQRQITAYVEQYRDLIAFLEQHTGQVFSYSKFREIMALANEQETYYQKIRDLILQSQPTPLNIADQLPATVIPQWHRGTEWARDRAKLFYDNTKAMVDAGEAACKEEKFRLMWLGVGLWQNLGFYDHFRDNYGAVFSWNEYLALAADGYRVASNGDPLETVAARMVNVMTVVRNDQWYLDQAIAGELDGVVLMGLGSISEGGTCGYSFSRPATTVSLLKRAGIPVCEIQGDPVNPARFDEVGLKAQIGKFIEEEVAPWQAAGRPLNNLK